MAVTFTDPAGFKFSDKISPLRFSTDRDVSAVSISFGGDRPEERIYRAGGFVYPYAASTRVGNAFTVRRTGGWPELPEDVSEPGYARTALYVDEVPVSAAAPAYQPNTDGPTGLWRLNGYSSVQTDLSGNGIDGSATAGGQHRGPDLVPGQICLDTSSFASSPTHPAVNPSDLAGEMTVVWRMSWRGGTPYVAHMNSYGTWRIFVSPNVLRYTNAAGAAWSSTLVPGQPWSFYAMRRAANGAVTFDMDGASQSSGPLALPPVTFRPGGQLRIGTDEQITLAYASFADFGVWPFRMSDAQILARRKIMMGLA